MEKILCEKCKNAYLQKNEDGYFCSSCGMFHPKAEENLLLGIHCYKEGRLAESSDYLMKAIVSDGSNHKALLYKALGDGFNFDEDSTSLKDIYEKIIFAIELVPDEDFPAILEIANDEMEKLELALAKIHIDAFETADAEKIKAQVSLILKIQEEALKFRRDLSDFADKYNERNNNSLIFNPSKCYLVSPEHANEIGAKKLDKIKSDVASHTVFTGILTTDIRNLEIYYRCIVMFFEKNRAKYDFLMANAENFIILANILEEGNYTSIQGTQNTAEKLKITAYTFLEESLKGEEADESTEETKSVIVIKEEPITEIPLDVIETNTNTIEVTDAETVIDAETTAKQEEIIETDLVEVIESDTVLEEITDISEISDTYNASDLKETTSSESSVLEGITEQETASTPDDVAEIEPTSTDSLSDIFENGGSEATQNNPFIYESGNKNTLDESDDVIDVSSDDIEAAKVAKTQEYPELSQEEQDDIARHERFKEIKTVNTETEEFQKLASKFDRARKNDPNRETTLVPKKSNKTKVLVIILAFIVTVVVINAVRFLPEYIVQTKYNSAVELQNNKNYTEAIEVFEDLGDYQDSAKRVKECKYQNALLLVEAEDYAAAKLILNELKGYNEDIATKLQICDYSIAKKYLEKGKYEKAEELFKQLEDYGDSKEMVKECSYRKAVSLIESKKYAEAIEILSKLKKYSDASEKINEAKYLYVTENLSAENETTVTYITELAKINYRNSVDLKTELLGTSSDSAFKFFVNTSSTDTETSLESVSHTGSAYFHVIVLDESYYDEKITIKYTTQYDYTSSTTVTFTKDNPSTVMVYPPTTTSGYTVTFSIHSADGTTLGSQKITIS